MIRVLTGATLIDGTGAAPVPDAAVVIDGDRIAAAGPRLAMAWPTDAEILDVRGRTIIPGLIDAHDHLASHGYALATRWGLDEPASTAHMRTARVLAETLAMGYTTVRDGGGLDAGFKVAVEQGLIPGPRLVLGIQIVSPTGGIGDRVSPSGHACCAVYDPLLPESVANGPDEVRDVVRTMVRAGADVIKTATTGGASSRPGHGPLDAAFSLPEMQALVTESHALGRRVMCHALGGPGAAHGPRGGRRFDRARVLPGRGAHADGEDGRAGHLLRAHAHRVRVPPRERLAPRAGARRRALPASRGERAAGARAGRADRRRHRRRRPRPPEERAGAQVPGGGGPHADAGACARRRSGRPSVSASSATSARSSRDASPTWSW